MSFVQPCLLQNIKLHIEPIHQLYYPIKRISLHFVQNMFCVIIIMHGVLISLSVRNTLKLTRSNKMVTRSSFNPFI